MSTIDQKSIRLATDLGQLELYMRFNQTTLRNDADRILFASTYLRGGAFEWLEPFLTDYVENPEDEREADAIAIFNSWEAFKERIKMVYGDVDETRTTERQILKGHEENIKLDLVDFSQYELILGIP